MEAAIAAAQAAATWLAKEGIKQALVKAAITVAVSTGASMLLRPKPESPQGLLTQTDLRTDSPRRLQIGTRAQGGVFVDWMTKGNINEECWRVFYLGEGPMGALSKVYIDGRVVRSTPIAHGQTVTLSGKWDRIKVTYFDGRPGQTAYTGLVNEGVGWTSNHVGTGCAYVVVQARFHDEYLFTPPEVSFEVEGAKLYDRRKDTTAGGSGSHRLHDPTTWELSTNPMVALDHYMLGRYFTALDAQPYFGMGLSLDLVPYANFAALANLCDENVSLTSGTQKRYAVNGFLFSDETHKDVILRLCTAMNARPSDQGGRIIFIDGEAKTPVLTVYDEDLIEGTSEAYRPKRSWGEIVNGVEGTYQDAANNYNPAEYPRILNDTYVDEDGGDQKIASFNLDLETDKVRAQRLATLFLEQQRRQAELSFVGRAYLYQLEDGDWFTRAGQRFGEGKVFEVVSPPSLDPTTMTVTITAVEVDPSDSAWVATDADETPTAPDEPGDTPDVPVPSVSVAAIEVTSGGATVPALRFTDATYDNDPPHTVELQVALDDGAGAPATTAEYFAGSIQTGQEIATLSGLLPSRAYVTRWRARVGWLASAWSSWAQVTTTATLASGTATSVLWSGVTGTGRPADNADVTGDNTAAAVTGQGALATLSALDYDSQYLTGFGSLAPKNWASFGVDVRRADGTTIVVDADAITAQGTAAAIAGQTAWATYSGSTGRVQYLSDTGLLDNISRISTRPLSGLTNRTADLITYTVGAATVDSLKPGEAGANVTETRTAAAITGQGAGATADTLGELDAAADELLESTEASRRRLSVKTFGSRQDWTKSITPLDLRSNPATALSASEIETTAIGPAWKTTTRTFVAIRDGIPVKPGDVIELKARHFVGVDGSLNGGAAFAVRRFGGDSADLGGVVVLQDVTPVYVADGLVEFVANYTVTANVFFIRPYVFLNFDASSAAPNPDATHYLESLSWREITKLNGIEAGADVTATKTAAAITGQGALATKGSVDLNSGEVTNKSLAALDSAANTKLSGIEAAATVGARAGTNLKAANGSTTLGDADVITADGTAAAIAGQGSLATRNDVDTDQIASGAVSSAVENTVTDVTLSNSNDVWQTVCTLSALEVGAVAIIRWELSVYHEIFGGFGNEIGVLRFRIRRGGSVTVFEGSASYAFGTAVQTQTHDYTTVPDMKEDEFDLATGSIVYTMEVMFDPSEVKTGGPVISREATCTMKAVGFKR